jgi:acetyltransferase-like isoleucine patch superfamily enzyme
VRLKRVILKEQVKITTDKYTEISYRMFALPRAARFFFRICGWISLPVLYPLVLISKISSETGFRTASELLSLIPFALGVIMRYEFYRRTLTSCGENVFVSFGTVFYYPQLSIGSNVLIGMFNTIHHVDFGSNVMTAEGCRFLSGSKYHNFDRTDVPMTMQGGKLKRIKIEDDVWIGANAVVMEDVGRGSVLGAGSVVVNKVEPFSIVAGNPARLIKKRIQD